MCKSAKWMIKPLKAPAKPWQHLKATYCNIVGQRCCTRWATLFQRVVTCWALLAQIWKLSIFSWNMMLHEKIDHFHSPNQTIATVQCNILQHCWPSIYKGQPNDRKILMQHIAALLGTTCCVHLATLLGRLATCWVSKLNKGTCLSATMLHEPGQMTTTPSSNIHKLWIHLEFDGSL